MSNPHQQKTPPEYTRSGAIAPPDPGPRNLNDPNWTARYREYIGSLPQKDYSHGNGEGINSE